MIEKILTQPGKAGACNASAASENRLKRTKRRVQQCRSSHPKAEARALCQ
ncbi:MAG: hypothetical protein WCJ87_04125 [Burkholderiales bacterium]